MKRRGGPRSTLARSYAGLAAVAAALTIASEARAYDFVIEDAEFRLTLQGDREPGCVVFPESATVEKDCIGLDLTRLRALEAEPGTEHIGVFAVAVEGGVVLTRIGWQPHAQRTKYPTRENLASIASAAASGSIPGSSARPVASVVRFADVDMVETRLTLPAPTGTRSAPTRSYTVPTPNGMVLIAFAATDERAHAAMDAFAEASMANMRVAKPPLETAAPEQTSRESTRFERLMWMAIVCALFAAGLVYVLRTRRN